MATLKDVINAVDAIKPNAFTEEDKTMWLNEVEGMVQTEVFLFAPAEIVQYKWSDEISMPSVYFPDDKTMVCGVDPGLAVGGQIKIDGLTTYTSNNSNTNRRVLRRSSDGLTYTFADNSFTGEHSTGTTADSCTLIYDGSETEMLVIFPHDKLYRSYLTAMIDWGNGEYNKYANTMTMFNEHWGEYMRWFARTYRPADRHRW